ncbi:OmpA family protein [Azoarcus sp. TTM-91]|uniref:OmpA family protein n=1 Tax=Azoarcus sp. TTM-91 TaxID=2691581 RepID=UPI00145F8EFA|nr:OmpA family protein [Azoarcus sp. TTM-91]NMG37112.1 OmpA family protein [Azoarcus sp. TTM-91]
MFDQEDGELNIVMGVLFGIIALVIAFVIGIATYASRGQATAPVEVEVVQLDGGVAFVEVEEVGEPLVKLYFEVGESRLPGGFEDALSRVVSELQARPEAVVLVSGYHDETGGAEINATLARQRALQVREALYAVGVPEAKVRLRKPAVTLGDGEAAEARRVEIRVQ